MDMPASGLFAQYDHFELINTAFLNEERTDRSLFIDSSVFQDEHRARNHWDNSRNLRRSERVRPGLKNFHRSSDSDRLPHLDFRRRYRHVVKRRGHVLEEWLIASFSM